MRLIATVGIGLMLAGCGGCGVDLEPDSDGAGQDLTGADEQPAEIGVAPCPGKMVLAGAICVDEAPRVVYGREPMSQPGLGFAGGVRYWDAFDACQARGLRLCLSTEREAACPRAAPFCDAADAREWTGDAGCQTGQAPVSTCCGGAARACEATARLHGYHCCVAAP